MLLLDEPLGALDLKLRQEMQVELKRIQQEVGITFVYVTHDQEEALTMSDRLAVFNDGRIEQVGAPAEVYEHPASEFIAGFVGVSNVLERGGRRFTIRPEKVRLARRRRATACTRRPASVRDVAYVGMVTRYLVDLEAGGELQVVRQNLETSSARGARAAGQAGDGGMERGAHVRDPEVTRRGREVRTMGSRWSRSRAALALVVGCGGDDSGARTRAAA